MTVLDGTLRRRITSELVALSDHAAFSGFKMQRLTGDEGDSQCAKTGTSGFTSVVNICDPQEHAQAATKLRKMVGVGIKPTFKVDVVDTTSVRAIFRRTGDWRWQQVGI